MFGLSLTKLLFTAVVIAGVWKLYRYLDARGRARPRGGEPSGGPRDQSSPAVEELIECTICGTYVPAQSSGPCDRPDCPHRA
jgi:hypothetical protein